MREIEFRGMTLGGRWVHGYLIKQGAYYFIQNQSIVVEKSIGQYTGLNDKNGKKIFEGDIIKSFHFESGGEANYQLHVIEWCDRLFGWSMAIKKNNVLSSRSFNDIPAYVYFKNAISPITIGNIHDNPDLLR